MSYILHAETGQKFEVDNKSLAEVQAEIKSAGLVIGNVTLTRMLEGRLETANGFELIQSLTEEERTEQEEALARAQADEVKPTAAGEVKEGDNVSDAPVIEADETVADANANVTPEVAVNEDAPVSDEEVAEAQAKGDEIRRRMLGSSVAEALKEVGQTESDATAVSNANAVFNKNTPSSGSEDRKRRHTKREEMVDAARASQYGAILAAIEAGVQPGVFLSYVNPDMRWFQFPITETADPVNLHARTNTYIDVAPIVTGGWGFSLYVNGKSATKRVKIKETDAETLVKAINDWLPGAIAETKAAA